jgi:hypothetical protein
LLACWALLFAASVRAEDQRRIVVLQPDEEVFRAISLSLAAWDVETTRSDAPLPAASQPEAVQGASLLAQELGVEAVVWITTAEDGSLLWVFDARAGGVTTRLLAESPPFDSAGAAAVALSVKTVLRSSAVAPPAERFGAQEPERVPPPPPQPPPPQPPPPQPPPPPPPPRERVFALELGAGGEWLAEQTVAFELELAAVAWIAASRRLGLSLDVSTGPGLAVDDDAFSGRYREIVAGASLRYRFVRERTLSSALALGGAVHVANLEGTLVEGSLERGVRRVNPSLDLELLVSGHFGSAYLGAALGGAYFPAYRRYLVEGVPVFSPWPVSIGLRGYCGVELF